MGGLKKCRSSALHLCGTEKPAVNQASLKQRIGLSVLQEQSLFVQFLSQLQTALFPCCYLVLLSGYLVYCCHIPGQVKTNNITQKNPTSLPNPKIQQIHPHVTAQISEGRYVRAAMCSHYLVTGLCWGYSNWDMFSSCKMKTPCLLFSHNKKCVLLFGNVILPGVS